MSNTIYKKLNLHYSDHGNGEVLVLLHGFLEEMGMWKTLIKAFDKKYRVICLDLLGHGSTENLGYIHGMEEQAQMLHFLLDELGVSRCTLVGHSMGGYIALAFADLYPDKVKGLCLMNSTPLEDDAEKKRNRDRGIVAVKQNPGAFIKIAIPNLFSEQNRSVFSKEIKEITAQAIKMSQQGIIASLEGMKVRINRSHLLEQTDFPVLVIMGKKDPVLEYQGLLQHIKNTSAQTVIFDDGHMSHIENQQELIEQLTNFL